ncbi:hypothetical protein AHiyo8_23700 [Arthrobacter sp. Hiyo8]|nr:hypothetical protein AHiyo8_23700 [Arthrobacter sp. Hiyo8]
MTENPDQETLRKASLKIAVRISAACAVLVLCLLASAAIYLFNQAQHPTLPGPGETDSVYAYLDTKDLLKAMIVAGIAGILLAGAIGWLSARSAIRPLGEALALQRRFVQDASHELRTPLAILDARVQLAQRDAAADSKTGKRSPASEMTQLPSPASSTNCLSQPPARLRTQPQSRAISPRWRVPLSRACNSSRERRTSASP